MQDVQWEIRGQMKRVLSQALVDINYLLVEGFDTNADDCEIVGVSDTIIEIKQTLERIEDAGQ